jgi:hypothetical protein
MSAQIKAMSKIFICIDVVLCLQIIKINNKHIEQDNNNKNYLIKSTGNTGPPK